MEGVLLLMDALSTESRFILLRRGGFMGGLAAVSVVVLSVRGSGCFGRCSTVGGFLIRGGFICTHTLIIVNKIVIVNCRSGKPKFS